MATRKEIAEARFQAAVSQGIDPTGGLSTTMAISGAPSYEDFGFQGMEYYEDLSKVDTQQQSALPLGSGLGAGAGVIGAATALVPQVAAAVPALAGAIPAVGTALAVGGGIYGILQALGLGEGEGLFGLDILGGDTQYVNGIPLGGPGLAEPPAKYLIKEWHVKYDWGTLQYYLVQMPGQGRKIAMYNTSTKKWKVWPWRKPHLAVIGKNMPSHKQLTRLKRNLARHRADADTILRLTSPKYQAYKSRSRRRK